MGDTLSVLVPVMPPPTTATSIADSGPEQLPNGGFEIQHSVVFVSQDSCFVHSCHCRLTDSDFILGVVIPSISVSLDSQTISNLVP